MFLTSATSVTSLTMRAAATAGAVVLAMGAAGCSSGGGSSAPPTSSPRTTASAAAPTSAVTSSTAPGSTPADGGDWTGYHGDQARTGAVSSGPALSPARTAWTDDLGGAVRGQPLVVDGHVIVTTERDRVVALDPASGAVQWSHSLGTALTGVDAVAGCGDIDPLGITSTPVADAATGTVYVVGEVDDGGGRVHHQLQGLDVSTGAVRTSHDVDPPLPAGESAVHLLQRASLALADGRVYVPYGGNDGDCGRYHGWVVSVAETGPADLRSFEVADDGEGGAIWQGGGAPAVDASGNLYVTTGNANPDPPQGGPDPKRHTESLVKLSPDLRPLASFKDTVAGGDEDLSTTNPVLLPDGTVFAVGKTKIGFLLRQSDLSVVARIAHVCAANPNGGPAYDAGTGRLFVPCRDGQMQVVDVARRSLVRRVPGADSAPVVVAGHVWATDSDTGDLSEYDPASGTREQVVHLASALPAFTSPSVGAGLMLVGTNTGVTALR